MDVSRLWSPVTRWGEFRRRQLAALEESNRIAAQCDTGWRRRPRPADRRHPSRRPRRRPHRRVRAGVDGAAARPGQAATRAGPRGARRRHRPSASSAGRSTGTPPSTSASSAPPGCCSRSACGSWSGGSRRRSPCSSSRSFLALALNPIVDRLVARAACAAAGGRGTGRSRRLIVVFVLIGALVIPPVVVQGAELAQQAPGYVENVLKSPLGARDRQELRRHRQGAGGAHRPG